jgi:hypothetical protein
MKKLIVLFFVFIGVGKLSAQFPDTDTSYFFLFGNNDVEEFRDVCNHSIDSGYVAVGTTSSFTFGQSDIYLVKTDWRGNTMWVRNIGSNKIENGYSIKETYDKGFIIGGYTNNTANGDYDMYLVKTDSFGWIEWEKKYGGQDWDFLYSLAIAPDSGFILCGETYSFGNVSSDVYVIRTDKNGDTLWTKSYGGAGKDGGKKVIFSNDSVLVVCGYKTDVALSTTDALAMKINYDNGDTILTRTFGGVKDECFNNVLQPASDSSLVFIGMCESFTPEFDKDLYYLKLSQKDTAVWSFVYGHATGDDEGFSVIEIENDYMCYTGSTSYGGGEKDIWAVVTIPDGYGFWGSYSPTYGAAKDDIPYALIRTLRKDFLFAGKTASFGNLNGDALLFLTDSILSNSAKKPFVHKTDSLVSIYEQKEISPFSIFPNPSDGRIFISGQNENFSRCKIEVSDLRGNLVYASNMPAATSSFVQLDLSFLSAGMYVATLRTTGGEVSRMRFCVGE